jgi:hypothetical protein
MNFQNKISFGFQKSARRIAAIFTFIFFAALQISAQTQVRIPPAALESGEEYTWWYVLPLVLGLALAGAVFWMLKIRKSESEVAESLFKKEKQMSDSSKWESTSPDHDQEMEWYRRHKKSIENPPEKKPKKNLAENLPKTSEIFNRMVETEDGVLEFSEEEKAEPQFHQLPIFSFQKLELARPFAPLAVSSDEDLMNAIDQARDEFEADEEIRDLAVRIMARFKTHDSVEVLSQIALYDLSSNLRSKAVSALADFDHESVFETILQACADQAREVRAAAARGLFRLSFDRADAWTRIAECGDEFRMRQAALAAQEADLVKRSFDRLVHNDQKIAYEAVTLLALMIRAGETEEIFKALESHHDSNVKLALVHVIGLAKTEEAVSGLYEIIEKSTISKELKNKMDDVIDSFEVIPA